MCFSLALVVLLVIQQLSCSFPIQRKVEDRGTSDLLQPTLLLFCQACCFGHTSRVKANGREARGRSSRTSWQQCPVDPFTCPIIIFMLINLFILLLCMVVKALPPLKYINKQALAPPLTTSFL